jgi:hypothetical protein
MLPTIDFNDESFLAANKVDHVRTDRLLTDKLPIELSRAQSIPQPQLSVRRIATEASC